MVTNGQEVRITYMKQKIAKTCKRGYNTECNGKEREDPTEQLNHRSASQCHTKVTTSHQSQYFTNRVNWSASKTIETQNLSGKKRGHKTEVHIGDQLPKTHLFVTFVFVTAPT